MVFYTVQGKGHPLVLLHSGGMSHEEWQPQLAHLSKHYKVIAIDLPGHGQTPLQGEKLSIAECGEAVLAVLAKENIDKIHLCGSSMGGATALWVTVNHPEKVEKLVIYRANFIKTAETFAHTKHIADPAYWEGLGLARYLSRLHQGQGGVDAWRDVVLRVRDALDPAVSDHGYSIDTLAMIQQPTLIVSGDRDPLVPMNDLIMMYNMIPNADLWILPHASHVTATNTWRSEIFAEEIHRFFLRQKSIRI